MKKQIPILILHGWNLRAARFQPLISEFEKRGYQVLCPDLPGFGTTKLPIQPYSLSDYVSFVLKLLKKQKINKVILIGHSFGGRIGIKFASEYPQQIEYLILTGAPGINPVPKGKILLFLYLAKIGKIIMSLPILSMMTTVMRKILYKAAGATDFYHTNEKMRETFKNVIKEDLTFCMKMIKSRTLLLWGENDGIVPLSVARKMKELIRNSKLEILPDSRHGAPWTDPELFTSMVEKYINSL